MRDGKPSRPSRKANDMQQIVTAKLKLITTPEQCAALRETQLAYREPLCLLPGQNQQGDQTAQRHVCRATHPLWSPLPTGL
jgi:hypothetical protein